MTEPRSHKRDIIVIGGSAGALEALKELVNLLPPDLAASIFVTLHTSSDAPSILPHILSQAGPLPARHPVDGESIKQGVIYVAPPDCHLLLKAGHLEVSRGPRENRHRPAVDPLFRTAARAYGSRVLAVVLSGQLDDGASGLMAVRFRQGLAVVQDPDDALSAEMPRRAMEYAGADYVLKVPEIARLIVKLTSAPAAVGTRAAEGGMPDELQNKAEKANLENDANKDKEGKPSAFACPECHGVLWEVEEGRLLRFRCRVGHAYTADALDLELSEATEDALWAALRVLEEKAALLRRMATRVGEKATASYKDQARHYEQHAERIRTILIESQTTARSEQSEPKTSFAELQPQPTHDAISRKAER